MQQGRKSAFLQLRLTQMWTNWLSSTLRWRTCLALFDEEQSADKDLAAMSATRLIASGRFDTLAAIGSVRLMESNMSDNRRATLSAGYGIKDWDDLRLFLAVVRGGHFQGAARILKSNQTTVARRFRRMEELLGTKLLERFGQEFRFTEPGKEIFHRAIAMEELARELNDRVRALDVSPGGTVKLAVTEGLASLWIAGRLACFCKSNPDINIELIPSHGEYDLLTSGTDVAIGWHRPTEPRLVGSKMGSVGFNLFASQDYVNELGLFKDDADVHNHRFLQYDTHDVQGWSAALMEQVRDANRFSLRTSSISVYLAALREGLGIALLPSFHHGHYPELIKMPAELTDRGEIWIVSHEETNRFRRTQMLLEFLRRDFRENGRHLFN